MSQDIPEESTTRDHLTFLSDELLRITLLRPEECIALAQVAAACQDNPMGDWLDCLTLP